MLTVTASRARPLFARTTAYRSLSSMTSSVQGIDNAAKLASVSKDFRCGLFIDWGSLVSNGAGLPASVLD